MEPFQDLSEISVITGGLLVQIEKRNSNKSGLDGLHFRILRTLTVEIAGLLENEKHEAFRKDFGRTGGTTGLYDYCLYLATL